MPTPIAVSFGWVIAGMITKQPMAIRNKRGITMLTLIGRGRSGLVLLNHNMPTTDAPTDSQSVCEK